MPFIRLFTETCYFRKIQRCRVSNLSPFSCSLFYRGNGRVGLGGAWRLGRHCRERSFEVEGSCTSGKTRSDHFRLLKPPVLGCTVVFSLRIHQYLFLSAIRPQMANGHLWPPFLGHTSLPRVWAQWVPDLAAWALSGTQPGPGPQVNSWGHRGSKIQWPVLARFFPPSPRWVCLWPLSLLVRPTHCRWCHDVTMSIWHVTHDVSHVTCDIQHMMCDIKCLMFDLQRVTCDIQCVTWYVTCDTKHVTWNVWCVMSGMQHMTYNMWYVTCDMWHIWPGPGPWVNG